MKNQKLAVEKRKVFGKKLKKLRREGFLPANIYGKDVKSVAVQVPYKEFGSVFKVAGETKLVDVTLDSVVHPALIHNIQFDYLNNQALHVDFFQVNLKEKVKTTVPIVAKGEAKAIADKLGLLLTPLAQLEIEALPTDLPENIEIDVTSLANVGDQLTVAQIKMPAGVTVLSDANQVVIKIGELISKEAAEQAAAEAAAKEAAKAASAATAATTDADAPATEGTAPKPEEAPLRPVSAKVSAGEPASAGQGKSEVPQK